jgi:hypothetical protein
MAYVVLIAGKAARHTLKDDQMSAAEDVKTLFRRFGGEAETYQEVVREGQAIKAIERWSMLGQVDVGRPQAIPSARRAISTSETRHSLEVDEAPFPVAPTAAVPVIKAPEPAPASVATLADPLPARTAMTSRPRANAPTPVTKKPAPSQPARLRQTVAPSMPRQAPKPAPRLAAATAPKETSALSARLRSPSRSQPVAAPNAPAKDHSLPGLFSRLSGTTSTKTKPGALQRKFKT